VQRYSPIIQNKDANKGFGGKDEGKNNLEVRKGK
jgi:hypothetical protein